MNDLAHESWVLLPENYELRDTILAACQKAGFTPRIVLDGGEIDTLIRLVASGLGITLIPRLAVQGNTDVVLLSVTDQTLQRSLGLVWRGDRVASPAARALREFIIQHLCQDCPAVTQATTKSTTNIPKGNGNTPSQSNNGSTVKRVA
jgi:DNA-binding transcriptional LysR family regulator